MLIEDIKDPFIRWVAEKHYRDYCENHRISPDSNPTVGSFRWFETSESNYWANFNEKNMLTHEDKPKPEHYPEYKLKFKTYELC